MRYDFIIIGSGLAGLNAALLAAERGNVLLVTKENLKDANTSYAQGGIASVWAKTDSFASHINDTMVAGAQHNDLKTVYSIVRRGPSVIRRLISLGIRFEHNNHDRLTLNLEGGHSKKRIVNAGDHTGMVIETALIAKVKANKKISIMRKTLVTDLLVKNKACYGIRILKGKKFINIFARRTIIASGGLAWIYEKTTNPPTATGDGIAMASRSGCKMKDLEFIQFHPTALNHKPTGNKDEPLFLISETIRGHGALLVNGKGKHFMQAFHPLADLAPRDIVSRAIYNEQKHGHVFLDCRMISPGIFRKDFPQISAKLKKSGINPEKDLIPVTPAAHYTCGGIKTNLNGETGIKNLFACGETACTGMHGANRLASNSLLEAAVMGKQAAMASPPKNPGREYPKFPLPYYKKQASTLDIRTRVRKIMWQDVGIVRKKNDLLAALRKLGEISRHMPSLTDEQSIITDNMLCCAILVTRAAIARKKSLGAHYIQ